MASEPAAEPKLEINASRQFPNWLAEQRVSLAFTTYQAGKLFLIGVQPDGRLSIFERTFNRCMGLWSDGQTLWMTSLYQLWRFENFLSGRPGGQRLRPALRAASRHTPPATSTSMTWRSMRTAGWCSSTRCSAAWRRSRSEHSFDPLWQPPFLEQAGRRGPLPSERPGPGATASPPSDRRVAQRRGRRLARAPQARRHRHGRSLPTPSWSTACRCRIRRGSTATSSGCSIPAPVTSAGSTRHRPLRARRVLPRLPARPGVRRRLRRGRPVAPAREPHVRGTAARRAARARGRGPLCGLHVVDLATGDVVHWLRIEGVVDELYDVVVLPGVIRPMALGFRSDEIRFLVRPSRSEVRPTQPAVRHVRGRGAAPGLE